jgi:hypothetical protein
VKVDSQSPDRPEPALPDHRLDHMSAHARGYIDGPERRTARGIRSIHGALDAGSIYMYDASTRQRR